MGATPVPIPNTMVKTQAADGTALVTVWESRWLPNFKENISTTSRPPTLRSRAPPWATVSSSSFKPLRRALPKVGLATGVKS